MSHFVGQSIQNFLTAQDQEAYRDGVPQRFILELQEHVKGKCHLTHGLEGLDVDNFLHGTECSNATAMSSASWCIVRRNGYHWTVELLRYAFFSYTAIMYFTAGVAGAFGALHHMWKAWRKQEKKSVGSWFVAESASPFGGELS